MVVFSGQGGADPPAWSRCLGIELAWDQWSLEVHGHCGTSPCLVYLLLPALVALQRGLCGLLFEVEVIQIGRANGWNDPRHFFLCLVCSGSVSDSAQSAGIPL